MLTQKLRLAATSLFLFVGLTTALFGALPAQTVFAQDSEPTTSDTEEDTLNTSPEEGEDGCEKGWNALDWIGCKVLGIIDETLDWLNKTINSLLFIDPVPEGIEGTWAVFRNLAYIILVPMMLLMVIGTAINMGPFDPYTVKKALPRMFIAVIFIALSLPLCSFFINVSNVIGNGAGNIITSLSGTELNEIDGSGTTTSGVITAGALLGLTGVISWPIVGSLGLVMVVGLLIGFFILILRQVLVVMLIILAPLAILVWIFPGNDKLWAVWRTTFTAMLFMYPLIAILIASGKFFAQTAQTSEVGGGPPVSTIVAMIGYVAPYFLIPATFKYGLGVFGNLAGMVNDRSRGFFDKQRKYREGARANARLAAREGRRFAGGNDANWRGKLNRGVGGTLSAPGAIVSSGNLFTPGQRGKNWRAATRTAMYANSGAQIERTMKENQLYQSWMNDDGLNRAAAESHDEASLRAALTREDSRAVARGDAARFNSPEAMNDAIARVQGVRRTMDTTAFKQMTTSQAIAGGTAYNHAGEVMQAIAEAAGNDDAATATLVARGRSDSMKAGRVDIGGAGFGTTLGEVQKMQEKLRRPGGSITEQDVEAATKAIHKDVYQGQGAISLVHSSMKPSAVKEMAPTILENVQSAYVSSAQKRATAQTPEQIAAADREILQSLASVSAVHDALGQSSPNKARVIADEVLNKELDFASLPASIKESLSPLYTTQDANGVQSTRIPERVSVQRIMEAARTDAQFQQMHKEYQSELAAVQRGGPPVASPEGPGFIPNPLERP